MTKDPENAVLDLHSPQIPKSKHQVTFTNSSMKKRKTAVKKQKEKKGDQPCNVLDAHQQCRKVFL